MVRIGLLGSGFVGMFYMQGLQDVPQAAVVANYSRSMERARAFAERWQIPHPADTIDTVTSREDVDLILIALPNHLHLEAALAAANHRKHVVCTKPLARNAAEAREMLAAVTKAGVVHGYAETEVFAPAVVRAHELIQSGAIGRVLTVRSREAHSGPHAPHFWDKAQAGGGSLIDMGCHCIEAARYFIGKDVRPVELAAWGDRLYHRDRTEAEDHATVLLRFESGALAQIETSWVARGGMDLRNEVYGTDGTIFTDITRGTPIRAFTMQSAGYVLEKSDADSGWVSPVPDEARVYGYSGEVRHFVECIERGETPRETFQDGVVVNVVLDTAYRAMTTKRWETIDL